jgi:hypothetical protein
MLSYVVDAHAALGSNVIWALGTAIVYAWSAVKDTEDPVKDMVAPVLGTPLAVKFALNQMYEPLLIGVPL